MTLSLLSNVSELCEVFHVKRSFLCESFLLSLRNLFTLEEWQFLASSRWKSSRKGDVKVNTEEAIKELKIFSNVYTMWTWEEADLNLRLQHRYFPMILWNFERLHNPFSTNVLLLYPLCFQRRIQNRVKHIKWNLLQKYFAAFSRQFFSQWAPSQMFDRVLNTPLSPNSSQSPLLVISKLL